MLTQTEYANVTPPQFQRPADQGTFQVPQFTPHHEVGCLQKQFERQEDRYKEGINVDQALKTQLTNALDPE